MFMECVQYAGYNIDSLVVGRTEVEELSRMTVVVNGTDQSVVNMKKQLEDVVHVAVVNILSSGSASKKNYVERDLMLAKVSTASACSSFQRSIHARSFLTAFSLVS
jgi:acetolactate synthase I/III small subunit